MSHTITGTITVGVTLAVNPTVVDGTIAATYGEAVYGSAAQTWIVANNGDLHAYSGVGIFLRGGAQITNTTHASIYGYFGGIDAVGATTISNAGNIAAARGPAIDLRGGGAITNSASGFIEGYYGAIVASGTNNFNLLNQGVISGLNTYGVYASGTIINARSGTILGYEGVILGGGTINNAGLIKGYAAAIYLDGQNDAEVIEQKTGTLIGGIAGFLGGDTIDEAGITITSVNFTHGTLTLYDGTSRLGTLSVLGEFNTNDFITSEFILKSDGHRGTNIEIGAATFTSSYKQITELSALSSTVAAHARLNGIEAGYGRNFTLLNHGTIVATSEYGDGDGVLFVTSGRIINTGVIKGLIGINAAGGIISNSGLVEGETGIFASGGTIINSGTIDGSEGVAIGLGFKTASTDIILKSGSVLRGDIAGFEAGDTINLASIAATGVTFANGVLTLTNAGKVVYTIAIDGFFNTAAFAVTAAKGGGTDITVAPAETFTGHYGTELVLSSLFTSIASTASFANGAVAHYGRNWTLVNAGTLNGVKQAGLLGAGKFMNTGTIVGATGVDLAYYSIFGCSLSNAGTIIGTQGAGISAYANGIVNNLKFGTISGASDGVILASGTFSNAGRISGQTGMMVESGDLYNTGRIEGLAGGKTGAVSDASTGMYIQGGDVTNAAHGVIAGDIGVKLQSFEGTLTDAGTIASTLDSAGTAIAFSGSYVTLVLDPGNVIQGAIAGFSDYDMIDFADTTLTSDTFSNHVLSLRDGTKTIERLTFAGAFSQGEFTLISEGSLGTELILNTLAASPMMHFLRPGCWDSAVTPGPFATATPPPQAKPATPTSPPTLIGWLPLQQTHPNPILAVTLQPG